MRMKMERFLGILLGLALVLGLMPGMSMTAYAIADPPVASVTSGGTTTNYSDFAGAVTAWDTAGAGAILKLLADVETSIGINVNKGYGNPMILDLNGYGIRYAGSGSDYNSSVIYVGDGGSLKLTDGEPTRVHYITLDSTGRGTAVSNTISAGAIEVTGGYLTGGIGYGESSRQGAGVYTFGSFTMEGGTIVGNTVSSGSNNRQGGGVYIAGTGTFNMNGGTITANAVKGGNGGDSSGGGVYVNSGSTFNMNGGTITGNTANTNGGGVYVNSSSTFTMTRGTISDNMATSYGGGVFNNGKFTMSGDSQIINNKATGSSGKGGGVSNSNNGVFEMNGGKIQGNEAVYYAGVRNDGGTFTMTYGEISGNKAIDSIGGVYVYDGTFTMTGGKIVNNEDSDSGSCGGVYALGTFNLSGDAVIKDNLKGTDANNVYLPDGKKITVTGALTSEAEVGVTMKTPGVFTSGGIAKDYMAIFTSDDDAYSVTTEGDELKLALTAIVIKAPTAKTLTYTGSAQELVTAGTAEGGTMQYALGKNATTAPTDSWSVSVPTGIDAGTYYVWYKVLGDENHADTEPEVRKVTIDVDQGETKIETEVKTDEKSPKLEASDLTKEVAESTLTDEEKAIIDEAVNEGKDVNVDVYLAIHDIADEIAAEDKAKLEAEASDAGQIAYFDISLFKETIVDGSSLGATRVHELQKPLKLTIGVPNSFPAVESGYTRTYVVLRLHNGEVTTLPATVNADGTISFETDRFSVYALVYRDTKDATTTEATTATTAAASTSDATTAAATTEAAKTSPKTGDSMPIAVLVVLMLTAAGMLVFMDLKKKKN